MINPKANSALYRSLLKLVLALAGFIPAFTPGATVWTGPTITYTQPGTDPTQPANQDRLTPNVWLTRAATQGLFNAAQETSYDMGINLRPSDTEWAYGNLADYASLPYSTWYGMHTNNPMSMLGRPAVLHLKSEDIYLAITFTAWGASGAGGFSYTRSTPATAPVSTVLSTPQFSNNQFTFAYTASPGLTYVVENSSNLVNWLPLATNVAASSPVHFTNSFVPNNSRYFRVGRLP